MIHENDLINALGIILVLIPSVILHEVSHGWIAEKFGDPTARDAGRITLNPVPHIDPLGSLILPGMLALAGQNVFGWARPVPVNPRYFRRPVESMAVVALAGPATNLLVALVVGRLGPFNENSGVACLGDSVCLTSFSTPTRFLLALLVINAALAVFNLLPIPPLDGSRLLPLVLGDRGRLAYAKVSQYGFFILFALLFVFEDSLAFLGDVINWVIKVVV